MKQSVYVIMENGQVFQGEPFGAKGEVTGEIVFTTGMTGYLETLTDPSYYGQIVVQTFPLIGNYGVIPPDYESPVPKLRAYIVREWCQVPSNFRSQGDIDSFLKEHNIVGVWGVDTRQMTKIIREHGVMNARITDTLENLDQVQTELKAYKVSDGVESVASKEITLTPEVPGGFKVILWDFGAKENIRRELVKRGCQVITVPASYKASDIQAFRPDGIVLSNGPGDPADNQDIIPEIAALCREQIPSFGICLGHQLLALSQGATTIKLKYGHRGANQPVKDLQTGKVYITSQNHGYAVLPESLPDDARLSFLNANDGTCEGIEYSYMPAFSTQFHPEAAAGPLDTGFLFDRFIQLMEGRK